LCAHLPLLQEDRSARRSRVEVVLAAMGLTEAGHTLVSGWPMLLLLLLLSNAMLWDCS
jgi:hypothetical protein